MQFIFREKEKQPLKTPVTTADSYATGFLFFAVTVLSPVSPYFSTQAETNSDTKAGVVLLAKSKAQGGHARNIDLLMLVEQKLCNY